MFTNNIETERLILRSMKQDDAVFAWSIWGDKEMGKYLHDPYYESADVLRELFDDIETWSDYSFVAFLKSNSEFIGTCSIGPEKEQDEWGIGYCVKKEEWGRGFATEMGLALISFARELGIRRFTGTVAEENESSGNVMKKCGMQLVERSSYKKKNTDLIYESNIYKMVVK